MEIPFTLYYGLVAAIPEEWKSSLKDALSRVNDTVEKATGSIKPLTTRRTTSSAFLSKMASSQLAKIRFLSTILQKKIFKMYINFLL